MTSRKKAYTDYIVNDHGFGIKMWSSYLQMPRKLKKWIKRSVEDFCYYDRKKKRVTYFNPHLLSAPVPLEMIKMFKPYIPANSGQVMRFRRFE